jgi:exodeoxyribonuclease VII large subunit
VTRKRRSDAGAGDEALTLFGELDATAGAAKERGSPRADAPERSSARSGTRRSRKSSPEPASASSALARDAVPPADTRTQEMDDVALERDLPAAGAYPGERPETAVAVSTLTRTAKDVLEGAFVPLWVRGEVSDFKAHRNGHWYYCLRDAAAQIRCVVWSRDVRRIPAPPDEGMQVTALGQLTVYAARGDMQLQVVAMAAEGDGLWRKALERTRLALERDGLLDPARKRTIPSHPRVVAVITSRDGAALHDIVSVARRRSPATQLVLVPAAVQGEGAPESLCAAIERVVRWGGADVLIIGRGGGAREDLWAFNDERVARALAGCPIPTVSAVGHEVDITICDLIADLRAATPSVAAEMVVPLASRAAAQILSLGDAMSRAAGLRVGVARARASDVAGELARAASHVVERRRASLESVTGRLHALSPLATLARGYAVVRGEYGEPIASAAAARPGSSIDVLFRDGGVRARVEGPSPSDVSAAPGDGSPSILSP